MTYSLLRGTGWALFHCALLCVLLALLTLGGCKPTGSGEDTEPSQTAQEEDQTEDAESMSAAEQVEDEESMSAQEQEEGEEAAASEDQGEREEAAPVADEGESEQAAEETDEKPLEWDKPRFTERKEEREDMVKYQIARRGRDVADERVLDAMRQVPRHLFVPATAQRLAYADRPLPIGHGQAISQPYIVALMTELLQVEPGDRILEIGTGSGYQAAVLTELTPYVFTIEIIKELGLSAQERHGELGYKTVKAKTGDGYYGWEEHGPFDGIIVTCAAGHIPLPLITQLKPGGRMVIPVGEVYETQYLIVVSKDKGGSVKTQRVLAVRFVPMTGKAQEGS